MSCDGVKNVWGMFSLRSARTVGWGGVHLAAPVRSDGVPRYPHELGLQLEPPAPIERLMGTRTVEVRTPW